MAWQNIQQATFRKIPFEVESVSDAVQRSAVLNEYPYRDGAEVEDLGLGPNRMRLNALLWSQPGDDYEPRLQVLLAALRTADAGELVHPIFGTIPLAVCTRWTVEHDAENRDRCTVQMEFVETRAAARIFTTPSPVVAAEQISAQGAAARAAADDSLVRRVEQVRAGPVPRALQLRTQMQAALAKLRKLVDTTELKVLTSELDPLFHPRAYVADAQAVLDRALQGLPFGGRNLLFAGKASPADATGQADFTRAAQALGPAALTLSAPNADGLLAQAHARVHGSATLAEAAAILLAAELEAPLLERADIERLAATTRAALQAAIEGMRATADAGNCGDSAAAGAALRALAYQVQQAAAAVIEQRPPVVVRPSPVSGPLRLVAHALYGDHTRAAELLRLNAAGRRLVVLRGEEIKAYAR